MKDWGLITDGGILSPVQATHVLLIIVWVHLPCRSPASGFCFMDHVREHGIPLRMLDEARLQEFMWSCIHSSSSVLTRGEEWVSLYRNSIELLCVTIINYLVS